MSVATADEFRRTSDELVAEERAAQVAWREHKHRRADLVRGKTDDGRVMTETERVVALAEHDTVTAVIAQRVEDAKAAVQVARVAMATEALPDAVAAHAEAAATVLDLRAEAERLYVAVADASWELEAARLAELSAARAVAAIASQAAPNDEARQQVKHLVRGGELPVSIDADGLADKYKTRPNPALFDGSENQVVTADALWLSLASLVRRGRGQGIEEYGTALAEAFAAVERERQRP
jgi:hypothetical protein